MIIPIMVDQAKPTIVLQCVGYHITIALLEDVQRHDRPGEEHDGQREEREAVAELGHRVEVGVDCPYPGPRGV